MLIPDMFFKITAKGWKPCLGDNFTKIVPNIGLRSDTFELISFNL